MGHIRIAICLVLLPDAAESLFSSGSKDVDKDRQGASKPQKLLKDGERKSDTDVNAPKGRREFSTATLAGAAQAASWRTQALPGSFAASALVAARRVAR